VKWQGSSTFTSLTCFELSATSSDQGPASRPQKREGIEGRFELLLPPMTVKLSSLYQAIFGRRTGHLIGNTFNSTCLELVPKP
jgi:hypothetical protein